jgi:hypothetical protein
MLNTIPGFSIRHSLMVLPLLALTNACLIIFETNGLHLIGALLMPILLTFTLPLNNLTLETCLIILICCLNSSFNITIRKVVNAVMLELQSNQRDKSSLMGMIS